MSKNHLRYIVLLTSLCTTLTYANITTGPPGTSTGVTWNPNPVMNPFAPPVRIDNKFQPVGIITVEDVQITMALQQSLAQNPLMAGATIRVSCRQGVVTLEGNAQSMAQVTQAASLAQAFPGVKGVYNKLSISPTNVRTGN